MLNNGPHINCPSCIKIIDAEARKCPFCHELISDAERSDAIRKRQELGERNLKVLGKGCFVPIAFCICVPILLSISEFFNIGGGLFRSLIFFGSVLFCVFYFFGALFKALTTTK